MECNLVAVLRVEGQDGEQTRDIPIYTKCFEGTCDCAYYVGGARVQLKPCRVVTKALLGCQVDEDWEFMIKGAAYGFRVVNKDCNAEYFCDNYRSVTEGRNYQLMSEKIRGDLAKDCLTVVDAPCDCTHALGCVPKGDGIRGIVDCSRPEIGSVNECVGKVSEKFSYKGVRDVTDVLCEGEYLSTVDISDAYRAIHTDPSSRKKQGLSWDLGQGTVYLRDNRLCMGLASAPYVFNRISDFVVRVLTREGTTRCVNYLDDFCIVSTSAEQGRLDQRHLIGILRHMGFDISFKKLTDPARVNRFLGIEIDSVEMCVRLPQDKMSRLQESVESYRHREHATKKELDQLAGLLAHCSTVLRGGRTFSRRIYDLCATEKRAYARIKLGEEFQKDIEWWCKFAAMFNGSAKIISPSSPTVGLYSDSSFWGYAAYHSGDWIAGPWDTEDPWADRLGHHYLSPPLESKGSNINVLELFPILSACERWGPCWQNARVCAVTDNTQVMWALRTGRSGNKTSMDWLRRIFWAAVRNNFTLDAVYIPTDKNVLCDSLSRLDDAKSLDRICEIMDAQSMCCYSVFCS